MRASTLVDAEDDARTTAENFLDVIAEMICQKRRASDDLLNDYLGGDSYHHENHTDKSYSLQEAAAVLDDLGEYEETDSGLWEGLDAKATISAMAAYTYANAVMAMWQRLIEEINNDDELSDLCDQYDANECDENGPTEYGPKIAATIRERIVEIIKNF